MQWNSWQDFWHMGGYGLYVWGSFGVTAAVIGIEIVLVRAGHQRVLRSLRDDLHSEESTI